MKSIFKIFSIISLLFLIGCSLSMPEFGEVELNEPDYKKVLEKSYDGYDDGLEGFSIKDGAKEFTMCATNTECNLLWDTAREWLTEKSNYAGAIKNKTNKLMETDYDQRKSKKDRVTFKVTITPSGKNNVIKITAECAKSCTGFIDKEYFAFNSYLKNHLLAYRNGIIGYEETQTNVSIIKEYPDEINFGSDLSDDIKGSALDNIDVSEINDKKKRYVGKVAESLIDEYSCNKSSEINLIKKKGKREIYEVNCIQKVKRMIFDCSPDGCDVLK